MSTKREDEKPSTGPWKKVDPSIWARGPPPTRFERLTERIMGLARISVFWVVVLATPLFVLLSFIGTYSLVGARLFGPVLILFWGGMAAGFVVVMEKTGYARNFEDKTFKLSIGRFLAIPLAFLIILGGFYFLVFVLRR